MRKDERIVFSLSQRKKSLLNLLHLLTSMRFDFCSFVFLLYKNPFSLIVVMCIKMNMYCTVVDRVRSFRHICPNRFAVCMRYLLCVFCRLLFLALERLLSTLLPFSLLPYQKGMHFYCISVLYRIHAFDSIVIRTNNFSENNGEANIRSKTLPFLINDHNFR